MHFECCQAPRGRAVEWEVDPASVKTRCSITTLRRVGGFVHAETDIPRVWQACAPLRALLARPRSVAMQVRQRLSTSTPCRRKNPDSRTLPAMALHVMCSSTIYRGRFGMWSRCVLEY